MYFIHNKSIQEIEKSLDSINEYTDELLFAQKHAALDVVERSWLCNQIVCRDKAAKKHPLMRAKGCIYSVQSIAQSTSEMVANYKANYCKKEFPFSKVVDLTGGLGAESFAFAALADELYYVEQHPEVFDMAVYNFAKLQLSSQIYLKHQSAEVFISQFVQHADIILVDPDRRASGDRSLAIETYTPNVFSLESVLVSKSNTLCIKHGPMVDITFLSKQFSYLKEILVISYKNEVKEIVTFHKKGSVYDGQIKVAAIKANGQVSELSFDVGGGELELSGNELDNSSFFYEPDKAIIKAGAVKAYAYSKKMFPVSHAAPYFFSTYLDESYVGRVFSVIKSGDYNQKAIKRELKTLGSNQVSVAAKGFYKEAQSLATQFKVVPGNDYFLFCWTDFSNKSKYALCKTIKL